MSDPTANLSDFVLQRIAEDEAEPLARRERNRASARGWTEGQGWSATLYTDPYPERDRDAAVLRSVKADRKILALHSEELYRCRVCVIPDPYAGDSHASYPCPTLRALGSKWGDHEAYRSEWAYVEEEWP